MARRFLLLVFFLCSAECFASGKDSASIIASQVSLQFSWAYGASLEPYAYWREKPLLPEYRIRRKIRIANVLLYTGGACLMAAIPFFIAAHNNRYTDTSINGYHNIHPPVVGYTIGGFMIGCTGIGLMVPGNVLRRKYRRQLAARR